MSTNRFAQFLTEEQRKNNRFAQFVPQDDANQSSDSVVSDLWGAFGKGSGSLVKAAGSLYGLATGDMDNAATRLGQSTIDYYNQEFTSDELKQLQESRDKIVANSDSELGAFATSIWETVKSGRLLATFVAEQVPMTVVPGGVGAGATKLAANAGIKAATKVGTGAAIGTGAVMQGADIGATTYDEIMALPDEVWAKNDDYQAKLADGIDSQQAKEELALGYARNTALAAGSLSVATQKLPGGDTIERILAGDKLTGGMVGRAAKGFGGEALQEGFEEGGGRIATNLGVQGIDENRNTFDGVGESVGLGMLGGGLMGAPVAMLGGGEQAQAATNDLPFEQQKADFEARIARSRQAGIEAEQRGDSPETIQRLRNAYTTVNNHYNDFLAKNDPNYVKPTQTAQNAQEQAKEEAKAQGGDALTQEVAATTTAGTEVPKAVDEELRIQRERDRIRQENARFDTPAIARKFSLMQSDAGVIGDELLARDEQQRENRVTNASMLAPQELPREVAARVFGEDSQYRTGTDNARVKSNGTPFPTAKSVQITPKYKQAVEQGLNPEIVKVGNGYGWELNNDTERNTGSLRGDDNQQTGSIGVGLPQQGQRDDAIADTANNNGFNNGQVDTLADGRDGNDNALEPQTETEVGNLSIVEAPLNELTLSKDVPQFKDGANSDGVVEQLEGKFDRTGTGPIQIWVRSDGRKEIISGRHRADLARRSGEVTIPAQYHYEDNGFTQDDAASLDAILNIRDGQGKVKDYVNYFKYSNTTRQEAESEGLLARRLGQRAYTIANEGTENLISQHANDQITDEEAYRIAKAAPGNVDLQNVGIKARQEGKTIAVAENMMRALSYMSEGQMTGGSFDLFGDNDAALIEAEKLAKAAAQKQADIARRLSAIRGAAKNPKLAAQEGIDIRDEQALNNRIQALQQEKNQWDNWHTDTAKVEQLRSELGLSTQSTDFGLMQESEQDRIEREQTEQQAQLDAQQAQQAIFDQQDADAQVDDFTLTGSNQPADIAMAQGQNDLFGAPQESDTELRQRERETRINDIAKGYVGKLPDDVNQSREILTNEGYSERDVENIIQSVNVMEMEAINNRTRSNTPENIQPVEVNTESKNTNLDEQPEILNLTRSQWINKELRTQKIKKGSPGFQNARERIEQEYDEQLDKALAESSFDVYQSFNNDTPPEINRKAYESLRESYGLSNEPTNKEASTEAFFTPNENATVAEQPESANYLYKANGKPFTTEKLARASKAFKDTPNAEVVAVDGGFAVKAGEDANQQDNTPIEDFGEKLEGARKDIKRVFKGDLSSSDIESQPLSKVWPKDAFDKIGNKFAEAFAYAARQEIPNKPRKGYKLARWVESVKVFQGLVQDNIVDGLMTGDLTAERIKELMKSRPALSSFANKVELLENIDKDKWSRIGDIGVYQGIRYIDGKEIPSKWVRIKIDNRMQTFYFDDNLNETFDAINDTLAGDKPTQTMQFEIRGRKGNYFINKKGDKDYTRLVEFTDLADARAYKRDNYNELVGKWEAHKERFNVKKSDIRGKVNAPRVGADHRNGKDITPEQFQDAFGFRGVQFGNWVNKDKERQQSLNDAYDGLMDLAGILNIPSKAISLEGKLGLAFGARGNGGRAAAHYESGSVVINLTKTKGAGSLAHEWFHALDNYFGNKRFEDAEKGADSINELFITYKPEQMMVHKDYPQSKLTKAKLAMRREQNPTSGYFDESNWIPDPEHPNGVRQVVEARFAELVETLEQSPMSERSRKMDKKPDAYWSQIIERGARAFENYIINKMRNNNEKNDYLANVVSVEDFARDPERYPYLLDNEIEPVEKAFDALFETIETKEDSDGNVTLFSTNPNNNPATPTNRATVTFEDANKVVERIVSGLSNSAARKGEIVLLNSYSELPQAIQDAAKGYDAEGRINGVFHNGKTYVVLDQHSTPQQVETTIFHELYGHNGIRRLFGKDIVQSLNKVFVAIGGMSGLKDTAKRNNINLDDYISAAGGMNQEFAQTMLMEELLAHLQQDNKPSVKRFVKETIGLIREKLRQLGFDNLAKYNDSDLFYLLKQARNAVQKDTEGNNLVVGGDSPMFSTNSNLDMSKDARLQRARDMGFDTNTVWYHGTGSDFTEFDLDKTGSHSDTGMIGRGFYFSNNPRISGEYAARGKQPNVIPVYLKSDSPFVVRDLNNDLPEIVTPNETLDDYMNAAKAYSQQLRDWAIENGYDSIVYEKPTGNKEIVVFEPNQIRSVNAEFDTEKSSESDIRFSINNNQNTFSTPQFETKLQQAGDWFVRNLQDKFKPIKDIQKSITDYRGNQLDDNENTYQAEELFYGKAENDLRQVEESLIKPLVDEMAATGIEQGELDTFLMAKHAQERNAYIASINPEMPDGGSGMTNAEAQQILTQATIDGKYDQLESLANKVYAITNRRKQLAEQAGLIDEGEWDNDYQFYVPLKGIANDEEGASRPRTGKGFDIRGNESLRAMGRRSKAESPLQHAISDLAQSIIRKRKNEVGQTFLNMVEGNPNPDLWQVFTDENPDTDRGMVNGEVVPDKPVDMRYRKDDYLAIKRNGTQYYVKVADKRIMNAMKNIGPSEMNAFVKVIAPVTRWMSMVNTSLNPEFTITNFSRDIQTAFFNALAEQDIADGKVKGKELAKKMVFGTKKAAQSLYRHSRGKLDPTSEEAIYIEEFLADGAKTGYFDSKDVDQIGKELSSLLDISKGNAKGNLLKARKSTAEFIENVNGAIENGVRLSAYMEARKAGISRDKAASFAKNLTVNFNRKGEAGNALNTTYMFFNAAVQGNANFLRAMATPKQGGLSSFEDMKNLKLNAAQKVAAGIVGATFGWAMLSREFGGEDDDGVPYWDKIPKGVRERNFVILKSLTGTGEGDEYYKIPLPYGYNIFANIGDAAEAAINSDFRDKGDLAGEMMLSLWASFVPFGGPVGDNAAESAMLVASPTIFKPVTEIALNKNFFGGEIYRENNPYGPEMRDSQMSMRNTGTAYKWLSSFMNDVIGDGRTYKVDGDSPWYDISPDSIEHLVEAAFGGLYRFGMRNYDTLVDIANDVPVEIENVAFARQLNGKISGYEDIQRFYEARQELKNIEAERENLKGQERIAFMDEYREKMRLKGLMSSADKQMKLLRKQRDRIEADRNMPMAEKERKLDAIREKMKAAADRFNTKWYAVD